MLASSGFQSSPGHAALSNCHRPLGVPGKEEQINVVLFVNEIKIIMSLKDYKVYFMCANK